MKTCTRADYEARLLRVLLHVQRNLDRALTLEELAGVAAFSPFHFHRIFRAMTGETVGEHVRRLRLERAAGQLRHTTRRITEIAFDAGFEAPETFARAFKAQFGQAPSLFRRERGAFSPPATPSGVHYDEAGAFRGFSPAPAGSDFRLDVTVRQFEPRPFAYLRHVGPYNAVMPVFDRALELAAGKGLTGPGTEVAMLSYDDPNVTDMSKLRADAGVILRDPDADIGALTRGEIAGGPYAVAFWRGPYDRIKDCYDWLYGSWLPRSGWEAESRPGVDVYHNHPDRTRPEDLLTEIRMPLCRP